MSHEIYYTSAPEGMKRGTSGFCTVAASENIPRSLLDRLESLSAYRHHFPAAVNSQNPVSFAHQLLNIGGTKYHVLSRICDSGVDHTQRTNAFAHHLVVENNEMAPAGPAWMLAQSGIMRSGWDGQVGTLRPRTLPQADRPAAICRRWAEATRDAGWGGQLADIFIKNPAKPVCLLFGPGQDVLSLMAETIALLPPMVRWNATFNTYFTSMPTSATCVWRCCLAGTPAAQVGLRYATGGGGLVIDLTDQSRLGVPANGPYVTMARTGQPPAGVTRTAPARPITQPTPKPDPELPRPAPPRAPVTPFPVPPLSPPPEEDYSPDLDAEPEEEVDLPMPAAFTASPLPAAIPTSAAPPPRISLPRRLTPIMREADAALQNAERQATLAATRRRRQVLILFFGGLIVIGLAMALLFALKGNLAPEPLPSPTPSRHPTAEAPQNPAVEVPPAPAPTTPPAPVAPAPPAPEIVKIPTPIPPVVPIPPTPPAPVVPAHQYPSLITCTTTMAAPKAGNGSDDSVQTISFPGDDLQPDDAAKNLLLLRFANGRSVYVFQKGTAGFFASPFGGGARVARGATEICRITIGPQQNTMELHWKAPALLRYPEVVNIAFWALQISTLEVLGRNHQHIAFKPIEFGPFSLAKSDTTLTLPMPLPKEAAAQIPTALPKSWKASTYTDWEAKNAALRKPEDAFQVIKLEKPAAVDGISSWFLITLRPGFEKVENNYAKQAAAAAADVTSAESDLRAVAASIDGFLKEGVKQNDPSLQPYLQKKDDISHRVDAYKQALAGYKEITNLDVAIEMPDGLHLTTLHFQRGDK